MKKDFMNLVLAVALLVAVIAVPFLWAKFLIIICQIWHLAMPFNNDEEVGGE